MGKMLMVRVDENLRAALRKRAAAQGKSVSEVAREILSDALEDRPLSTRVGHLRGQIKLQPTTDACRMELRDRNWRP
jgi:plasmid stability protein